MSMLLDRLLMWIAGVIDRNLLTVPDLDDDLAAFRAELTRPNDHDAVAPHPFSQVAGTSPSAFGKGP